MFEKAKISKKVDSAISDQYRPHRSDNCIIIPRKCRSEKEGVLLASASKSSKQWR